jgi:hypothetical protein
MRFQVKDPYKIYPLLSVPGVALDRSFEIVFRTPIRDMLPGEYDLQIVMASCTKVHGFIK